MSPTDYQHWMEKAFLYVEAALGQELATPSRVCMTEDYFRSALVRGMAASRPDLAHRIKTEEDALWTGNSCWQCHSTQGQRRPIQHDVAVMPNGNDNGLLCEVKWLKAANASAIGRDVWKLILSRGTTAELQAKRTYLLIGGERRPLSATLATLRASHIDLRWSNAGRGAGPPASRELSAESYLASALGDRELKYVLGWGTNPRHVREPPASWASLRITRRFDPWVRTIDGVGWRAVLFEIHHHGAASPDHLAWAAFQHILQFTC
jgi:hypothetical protein